MVEITVEFEAAAALLSCRPSASPLRCREAVTGEWRVRVNPAFTSALQGGQLSLEMHPPGYWFSIQAPTAKR